MKPLLASIILLSAAVFTAGCARSDDPGAPQPDKVYRDAFEAPPAAAEIEADGGTIIGAYDAWLLLRPRAPLPLRHGGDYRPVDCAPVAAYLARELALAGKGHEIALQDCRERVQARLPFDNGRWFAREAGGERVFYRVWKYR